MGCMARAKFNGTSGYEEVAAQGLIAGINAARLLQGKELNTSRSQAYIGVLIDDIITKGISELHWMLISRAISTVAVCQDNADLT